MNKSEIERLAYWLWRKRGMPIGSPDVDWLQAEELIDRPGRGLESALPDLPLFAFGLERTTG